MPRLWQVAFPTVCFGLGCWQLYRLRWKEDLLARLDTGLRADPLDELAQEIPLYQRLQLHQAQVKSDHRLIGPRGTVVPGVTFAYQVIRPIRLEDGRQALLNCGWLPHDHTLLDYEYPNDLLVMREAGEHSSWLKQVVCVSELAEKMGTEPILLRLLDDQADGLIRTPPRVHISNRHLEYTLTWFGLGLATALLSLLK